MIAEAWSRRKRLGWRRLRRHDVTDVSEPTDPIAAVVHPDPYPYYRALVGDRPLHRREDGLWIASGAAAVAGVLESDACRVRPAGEAVPRDLAGTPAGEVFGRLVRMSDGTRHGRLRPAVAAALAGVSDEEVAEAAESCLDILIGGLGARPRGGELDDLVLRLPACVVATLLGLPAALLPVIASRAGDFARGVAPGAAGDRAAAASAAAQEIGAALEGALGEERAGLLARLAAEMAAVGSDLADVVANAIGLFSQAHDATAGLIGGSLVALARHDEARRRLLREPALAPGLVAEVLRFDPPIQNTRRFVAEDTAICGERVPAGSTVLVLLAAANRDPALNPRPDVFDPERTDRRWFAFGAGRHACPGERIATRTAVAAIGRLVGVVEDDPARFRTVGYRPSVNARVPVFGPGGPPGRGRDGEPAE
jgi:cytochrome P450